MNIKFSALNQNPVPQVKAQTKENKSAQPKDERPQITELRAYYAPMFKGISDSSGVGLKRREQDALPPELRKAADNITAAYTTYIHPSVPPKVVIGRVKDYIADSLSEKERYIDETVYHATSEGAAKSIVKNGFDFDKYGSIKTGPGVYFTDSPLWGQTMCGNGNPIVAAHIQGKAKAIDSRFFDNITDNKEFMSQFSDAIDDLGLDIKPYDAAVKYVRELIADEFGLDMLLTTIGGGYHYVVYNPDAISDVHIDENARDPKNYGIPTDYYKY